MNRPRISACVITFNEENNIGACLRSIDWVDEIIVVDAFSSDGTTQIAAECGAKVFCNDFKGFIPQKNFATALTTSDWVLNLDADERVSQALRDEIIEILSSEACRYRAYRIPRLSYYLGRWIHHSGWYPDAKIRLWKKGCGVWGGKDPHEFIEIDGSVNSLKNQILHYPYNSVFQHLEKMNRYTTGMARDRYRKGQRFSWLHCLSRPPLRFLRHYVLKRGFLDGTAGFFIAVMAGYYVFQRYVKLWEIENDSGEGALDENAQLESPSVTFHLHQKQYTSQISEN